ncbi:flagella basal body P-ring formation protein FlgA [Sphingobium lactosutens]|uniref:flagellar basal body P-ring formation chaperone FlgA n=1 Tax=Sphingobium lactosutens TaxID=522773 RepID=UPI0015BE6018|nr:flagellar basal body P-ring formation chaperone FlgA [Sphingobium lactosutens]NWK98890.1 flagella basal body P-ring formation protein FlgA [Sphingobium lactosutens]
MIAPLALLAAAAIAPSPTVDTPVLARMVEKGEMLSAADFTSAPLSPATARGATAVRDAAGREATRRLAAGSPVRASDIAAPSVIRRGEAVTIALISGALRITAGGRALGDAGKGEPVRVINLSTNRTIDAVADRPGQVRVMAQ